LIELLMKYDLALGPGGGGIAEGFTRPKSLEIGSSLLPDMKAKIYVRNRQFK